MAQQDFSDLLAAEPGASKVQSAGAGGRASSSDFSDLLASEPVGRSGGSDIDAALAAEGVTGRAAEFIKSIYSQESSSGRNTKTSNAGAVGGMQILPGTFRDVADKGWDINNKEHNLRAGIRYAKQGYDQAGGDLVLAGAYYYGGPGGLDKARRGIAVSDPRNPNAPDTLQYGREVASRVGVDDRGVVAQAQPGRSRNPYANTYREPAPEKSIADLVLDAGKAVWQGAKSTGRSVAATGNTYMGNLSDVELLAKAQQEDTKNDPEALAALKAEIQRRQQENPDAGILKAAGDVISAAWDNKAGTMQLVAEQAPNAVVSLGSGFAGAKAGASIGSVFGPGGAAVGGTLGFLSGMFLGNMLIETGGKAQEMAADGFTADEARAAKEQGAVKAGVITAVDAATLGAGRGIARAINSSAIKAGARAEAKVLSDAGVDITNGAEIVEALAKNPALRESATNAGRAAAAEASKIPARAGTAATLGTTETIGEGTGEYLGELAATGQANPYDAATEAIAGFAQSAPEVFWSMTQSSGNDLDVSGITEVAKKAQEPNSPLSKTVLAAENARLKAGIPSAAEQAAAETQSRAVDPVARLAELEAIGRGRPDGQAVDESGNPIVVPGEKGRFFTPDEKAEYEQLKALRDATPGMQPEAEAEVQPQIDEILERTRAIEQALRTNRGLEALRSPESPYKVGQFLNDLARAKSKSTPAAQREQALARIETVAEWMGVNLGDITQGVTPQSNEQAGPPTRTQQVGQMITSTPGLSSGERNEALQAMMTWRNTRLPERTRQMALDRALEIVGRAQAPEGRRNPDRQPAVLRDIAPQEGTLEYFLREAERREDGAYQFRSLGYDDEADALLLEAESMREAAASARAGTLNVEDSAEADADIASQSRALSVDEASGSLPRVQIPASTDQEIGEASTALRRKRKAQIAQIVGNGFDTVERSSEGFVLRNTKTGQSVLLDGMADAQIARNAIKARVDELANTAAASPLNDRLEPTEAQIKAGNYKKSDVIEINGVKVVIENPRGSVRRGVGADGKPWETKMAHHYGEIVGTEGADGDRVDVFIGDRPASNKIFVIDQVNQDGAFDEHKLVFGAVSEADARQTYLANYDKGWTGLGAIKELPLADLKTWLKDHAKKPAAESGMGAIQVRVKGKTYTVSAVPVESLPASSGDSPSRGVKGTQITKQQAILLKGLAGFFGKDIVFFSDPQSKIDSDGFVIPGDDVTIYLNERSGISPLAVFGHELMHILRRDNRAAYDAIAKVVAERVKDPKGFRESYYGKDSAEAKGDAALNDGDLEELISDLNGDLMSDGAFWRDVFAKIQEDNGAQAKSIIASLAAFFQKMLDSAIAALKGQPSFRASRFISDAEAVRNAFRDGMAMYAQGAGISKAAMQAELLKAQQKLGDIKRSAPRPDDGLTVDGYHFSKQPRQILSTGFFGTGLQGSDREEIMSNPDMRLRQRLSFYVNKGTGIRPESGVGPIAHKATLTNIYDADADVKRLKQGRDKRAFETAVINAGYSGYLTRLDGSQPGQVILLGSQTVKPEVLGMRTQIDDAKAVPAMAKREADLGDKLAALQIPLNGQLAPSRWSQMVMARDPELAAQLLDIGAFDGDKPLYKDELVRLVRDKQPEVKLSTKRAADEYAEVEAKYKGTDQWMKAPNGNATNLNERQWVQVRTPAFKKWFGDWEAAIAKGGVWADDSTSKVVDENGEPLVVYHGTDNGGFMEFEQPGGTGRGDLGIFTTPNWDMARSYVRKNRANAVVDSDTSEAGDQPGVYALFINIRDPNESDFEGATWNGERFDQYQVFDEDGETIYDEAGSAFFDYETASELQGKHEGSYVEKAGEHYETTDSVVKDARRYKNDGAIIRNVVDDGGGPGAYGMEPADVFVALLPNQLKSADFNGGEFSAESDDIRFSKKRAAEAADGDKTDVTKLATGRPIPESAAVGSLEKSLELARSKSYRRGRDLKKDLQDRVLAAAKSARVNLSERTKSTFSFLSSMVYGDAKYALKSNENAVGWYDQKVSRAIGALSTVHPEINTDKRARLAFLWALATTSNGLKVDKNFELAEKAYASWKKDGRMPTNIGIGNAAGAINKGMKAYNDLSVKVGEERLLKFMGTKFEAGQIERMLGISVGGEWKGTPVRGAAILGPKIGNGFFSNLNGYFDALTMDRWLMRTWGRMTGTLLEVTKQDIDSSRKSLANKVGKMTDSERRTMAKLIGHPVKKSMTRAELDAMAKASQKASMKKEKREVMMSSDGMNDFRKAANLHHMTMDGQKEAPAGPSERNWIRAVFQDALSKLQADGLNMTMSDLQALLWYPERRLYDAAKSDEDVADGYEDDEAPDYANAAFNLAIEQGIDRETVMAAMDEAEERGTVQGEQLSDEEKAEMLEEFRAAPKQPMQIVFEAAPDPDNAELTERWNTLPFKQKASLTKLVRDSLVSDLAAEFGLSDKVAVAMGSYMGAINPNMVIEFKPSEISYEEARAFSAFLGIALDQNSVALVDGRGKEQVGIIRIALSSNADKHAEGIMKVVNDAFPDVIDFTARGKSIDILSFGGATSTEEMATKIADALENYDGEVEATVTFGDIKSELIGKDTYESEIRGARPRAGQDLLERARAARDRARQLIAEGLGGDAVEVSGRTGSARRADAGSEAAAGRADSRSVQDAGGVRRSPGRVAEQGRSYQGSGREEDGSLSGLPRDFTVAGIDIRASHWAPAEAVARKYMEQAGLEYRPPTKYAKVDKERAARIAAEYDRMKHDPKNPVVKAAYKALAKETIEQYRAVIESGLKVEFIDFASQGDPYAASPRLMTEDVRNNNHMWVFSTRDGFGTDASFDPEDNPLLAETEFEISGQKALVNDLFRVVHDYFGHVKEGVGFRADGEENTWRAHSSMFSPLAQRALTTETRGQNSWVNFGPYGEKNRTASAGETHFADQKTGLLPLWVSEDGRYDEEASTQDDDMTIRIGEEPQKSQADEYNQRIAALEELIACLNK